LLESRPRALSKAQIRDRLWPRTFVSDSNLTSLVNELRGALGDPARRPRFIRTVYGFGYAFCGEASESPAAGTRAAPGRPATTRRLRLYLEDIEIALREGENLLGRVEEGVTWLESPTVSRRHARILVTNGRATLEHLGSKNGTYLRGERLRSPTALTDGDEIRMGQVVMTFRVLSPAASTRTHRGR
jgi:hypothetical protein